MTNVNSITIASRTTTLCQAMNYEVASNTLSELVAWISMMVDWNKKIDLTAARNTDELVDLCIADAIVLSREIAHNASVVDVGSGAGAPGLALAIIRKDAHVTLVEPLSKRVAFLRNAIGTLRIETTVKNMRGDQLTNEFWNVAVSRATFEPAQWLALGTRLVGIPRASPNISMPDDQPPGRVAVLLARKETPTTNNARLEYETRYRWPLTRSERRVLWYRPQA